MTIKFQSEKHERDFRDTLSKMKSKDCYHKAVAYLLTLDEVCNKHIDDLFDFEKDVIKPFGTLTLPWQTGTSVKTTRLMFNLWSGVSIDLDKSESVYEEAMMKFVTGAPAGSGLIYCGLNGSLPFKDDFPTDTKLYKLMTTKFGE